jgi:hypothetical protein
MFTRRGLCLGVRDARQRLKAQLGLAVVMRGQAVDLLDVKNRVALHVVDIAFVLLAGVAVDRVPRRVVSSDLTWVIRNEAGVGDLAAPPHLDSGRFSDVYFHATILTVVALEHTMRCRWLMLVFVGAWGFLSGHSSLGADLQLKFRPKPPFKFEQNHKAKDRPCATETP